MPLVAPGADEVDFVPAHVQSQSTKVLDGVDEEQHASGAAGSAQGFEFQPEAIGPLHGTDREQASSLVHGIEQSGFGVVTGVEVHRSQFDAPSGQGFPGQPVAGEIVRCRDNVIAAPPVQAVGQHVDSIRGVFEQRDLRGGGRIEHVRCQ